MKQRHNSRRRRHKTAKKHNTASLGAHKDETGRGLGGNVRRTVKKSDNRISKWRMFKSWFGRDKAPYNPNISGSVSSCRPKGARTARTRRGGRRRNTKKK